jgi:hypothetical protein
MRIEDFSNPHLKRAFKLSGLDDQSLLDLASNHQISIPWKRSDEPQILKAIMIYCSNLKTSRDKQRVFHFHEIQNDSFLLKTLEQQKVLIENLQYRFSQDIPNNDSDDIAKLDLVTQFCKENNIDLISAIEHIWEQHPYFPLETSQEQINQYFNYFKENATIYRILEINIARVYADCGYRRVSTILCAAKLRRDW